MLRILLPALLIAVTSPALADGKTACWDYGASPGVFGWEAAPSTMCRDGQDIPGASVTRGTPPGDFLAANTTGADTSRSAELTLTFSGEAYVGLAVVKR